MTTLPDLATTLWTWTPFLLQGFGWNLLISLIAMLWGTLLGAGLAHLRLGRRPRAVRAAEWATTLTRNVPTIVFQFYLAVMLPGELPIPGTPWVLAVPAWLKAALALSVAVIGFTSDNLAHALALWRAGDRSAALLFLPSWTSYYLIIVIASSTASIIGVGELISRCNTVANAESSGHLLLPVYLYASLFFLCFCYPLTRLMRGIRRQIQSRWAPAAGTARPA